MRFSLPVLASLISFSLVDVVLGSNLHAAELVGRNRHAGRASNIAFNEIAKRSEENKLAKRETHTNARFSFFVTGLGACGKVNSRNDFVVALNHAQYDSGDYCFKTITITYGGKTAQAQIVDRCVECPYGALDFTYGLFDYFGPESAGYLYGTWTLGGAPEEPTTTKAKPTPTPTPTPKPTTTSTKKTTTSTTSTSSSTSTKASSTSASTSSTAFAAPTPVGVWAEAHQIVLNLGGIAVGAAVPA